MQIKFFLKKAKQNYGFTLVETLVALSIFSVSIVSILMLLSQGISSTTNSKNRMIASYLSAEGVEYIRNLRDTYVLYGEDGTQDGWDDFKLELISSGCQANNGCYFSDQNVDYEDPELPMIDLLIEPCAAACPELRYDALTGSYQYISGADSGYTRKIEVEPIGDDEIKIQSTVSWSQGSGMYSSVFSDNLLNWIEN